MAKKLQFKRSETVSTYTPVIGEPIYDIARKQIRLGDGTSAGGIVPKELFYVPMSAESEIAAEGNSCVVVDCSEGSITINLPETEGLASGTVVKVIDAMYAASSTNTITVVSTTKINNLEDDFIIDLPRAYVTFIYVAETENWLVDLGGIIIPAYEIATTDELEWNDDDQLGIKEVSVSKVSGTLDLGTF